jgi:hypothetical protein
VTASAYPLHIHRSGLPAATQAGTCFQPSLLFTLPPALLPSFSTSYCEVHSSMSFPMRQRRGHINVCQFSHMRTVGKSDRTPSTRHATHHHQSRESVCKQRTVLYHCHCVPFPTKRGTNSCSQTLAPCSSYNIRKILAPRKAEPPLTPFGSNPSLPTHCKIQAERTFNGGFLGARPRTGPRPHDPSNGHVTITSRIRIAPPTVHPPAHLCSIFTGLHAAHNINAGSLIKGAHHSYCTQYDRPRKA